MILDATTTIWRYGGQEIIQSPAGTISQANTAQLLVVVVMLIVSGYLTTRACDKLVYDLKRENSYLPLFLAVVIFTVYLILFLKICALLPKLIL